MYRGSAGLVSVTAGAFYTAQVVLLSGDDRALGHLSARLDLLGIALGPTGDGGGLLGDSTLVASAVLGLSQAALQILDVTGAALGRFPGLRRRPFRLLAPLSSLSGIRLGRAQGVAGSLHRALALARRLPLARFCPRGRGR